MADFPCSSLWNAKVGIKWEIGLLLPLLPRNQSDWVPGAARLLSELSRHPPPPLLLLPRSLSYRNWLVAAHSLRSRRFEWPKRNPAVTIPQHWRPQKNSGQANTFSKFPSLAQKDTVAVCMSCSSYFPAPGNGTPYTVGTQ